MFISPIATVGESGDNFYESSILRLRIEMKFRFVLKLSIGFLSTSNTGSTAIYTLHFALTLKSMPFPLNELGNFKDCILTNSSGIYLTIYFSESVKAQSFSIKCSNLNIVGSKSDTIKLELFTDGNIYIDLITDLFIFSDSHINFKYDIGSSSGESYVV